LDSFVCVFSFVMPRSHVSQAGPLQPSIKDQLHFDFSVIGCEKDAYRTSMTDFSLEGILQSKQHGSMKVLFDSIHKNLKETVKGGTRRITPKICSSSGELSRSSSTVIC
jgi:hypothetical protein